MTFLEETIIGGFIGEAISKCVDTSWIYIKKVIKDRKNKKQNIESQIYNVIINVLNQMTYDRYRDNQDKMCQAAERLLIGYKYDKYDNFEAVKSVLQFLGESVDYDKIVEFKVLLYRELSKNEYGELCRQIRLLQQDEERNTASRIEHSVNEVKQDVEEIKKAVLTEKKASEENTLAIHNMKFQNNKKQDYIKNWNSRLFLHVDNDENPITLADAFIMPEIRIDGCDRHFTIYYNVGLESFLEQFMHGEGVSTLLITGEPGIGKTCITSWIAMKYESNEKIILLRFRDWETEELAHGILKAICYTLRCKKSDLSSRILVLDGFDEIKLLGKRQHLLNEFFNDINDLTNCKIIITSRPAYIESYNFINKISLLPFDEGKICAFYKTIVGETLDKRKIDSTNLDVLGIPVILYMAIMSKIDITRKSSKPELYSLIFGEQDGIFDRFSEYDSGTQILRNSENKRAYLLFLREIAFEMFSKNKISIPKNECNVPVLTFRGDSISILEFPIKHFFENTKTNIEFIHNTIYEYFVSQYIYETLAPILDKESDAEIDLACVFGCILVDNRLTPEIVEFLKYTVQHSKLESKFDTVYKTFCYMLKNGMASYTNNHYKNAIEQEMTVFVNMLEIVHLWEKNTIVFDNMICNYIKQGYKNFYFNLLNFEIQNACFDNANLSEVNFRNTKLIGADFKESFLLKANLTKAILISTDFRNAVLRKANLTGAELSGSYLNNVDLREAILLDVKMDSVELSGADLRNAKISKVTLTNSYLCEADFRGAELMEIDLRGARLDKSIWSKGVIPQLCFYIKEAEFTYIILEDQEEQKRIYREELLSSEDYL